MRRRKGAPHMFVGGGGGVEVIPMEVTMIKMVINEMASTTLAAASMLMGMRSLPTTSSSIPTVCCMGGDVGSVLSGIYIYGSIRQANHPKP